LSIQRLAYPLRDALYLNITNSCTLACKFCPKVRDGDWTIGGFDLRLQSEPSVDDVWLAAVNSGIGPKAIQQEVVFTGFGEATRRLKVLLELVRRLKNVGVQRIRLDTDGLANLREGRNVVPELVDAGLGAVCVSLNAPDANTYASICPNRYGLAAWKASCDFIRLACHRLPEVTASFVALPDLSEAACRDLAESLGARFRWRPYDRRGSKRDVSASPAI
jgi:GTP 3',8-cyclase